MGSNISHETVARRVTEASGDRDTLDSLATLAGRSYVAGVKGWSLAISRLTYAASVADVFGDKRSKDSTALVSVKEYADRFNVTGPIVARWNRAGLALHIGVNEGDVSAYLSSPNAYDTETLDKALAAGKPDAFRLASTAKTAAKEKAAADRVQAKRDAAAAALEAGDGTVTRKGEGEERVTTATGRDLITLITTAIGALTPDDVTAYVQSHGEEEGAAFGETLDAAARWVLAHVAGVVMAEAE